MNRLVTLGVKGGPSLRPGGAMPTSSLLELDGQSIVISAGKDGLVIDGQVAKAA